MDLANIFPKSESFYHAQQKKKFEILRRLECWPYDVPKLTLQQYRKQADIHAHVIKTFRNIPVSEIDNAKEAIRIFMSLYDKTIHYLLCGDPFIKDTTRIKAYNTVWTLIGYGKGQDRETIKLAAQIVQDKTFFETARLYEIISSI